MTRRPEAQNPAIGAAADPHWDAIVAQMRSSSCSCRTWAWTAGNLARGPQFGPDGDYHHPSCKDAAHPQPMGDERLRRLREEVFLFDHIHVAVVRRLLARLDARERQLRTVRGAEDPAASGGAPTTADRSG